MQCSPPGTWLPHVAGLTYGLLHPILNGCSKVQCSTLITPIFHQFRIRCNVAIYFSFPSFPSGRLIWLVGVWLFVVWRWNMVGSGDSSELSKHLGAHASLSSISAWHFNNIQSLSGVCPPTSGHHHHPLFLDSICTHHQGWWWSWWLFVICFRHRA